MNIQEILPIANKIKKGTFVKVAYVTYAKNGYSKVTETIVRFVDYNHIKGVQSKGKANANEHYLANSNGVVFFNSNTNQHYIRMAVTNGKSKAKVKYYSNGMEIDKATYELANPPKASKTPLVVFTKNINDIISLG